MERKPIPKAYAQNRQQPRLKVLNEIANILDVDIKDLITSNLSGDKAEKNNSKLNELPRGKASRNSFGLNNYKMEKKAILLFAFVISSSLLFSQEILKLKLTPEGVDPVILTISGKSAAEIYKKSLEWVQETYEDPDDALKANIENKKIRINGFTLDALSFKNMVVVNWGVSYTLEISFKDGKSRFDYNIRHFTGLENEITKITYQNFYKKNGEIRKSYLPAVSSIENTMNDLLLNYFNYVTDKTDDVNDW